MLVLNRVSIQVLIAATDPMGEELNRGPHPPRMGAPRVHPMGRWRLRKVHGSAGRGLGWVKVCVVPGSEVVVGGESTISTTARVTHLGGE